MMLNPTNPYNETKQKLLSMLIVASLSVACTQTAPRNSDTVSNQTDSTGATSTSPTSTGSAASQLPLAASAPAPASLTSPRKPESTAITVATSGGNLPVASVGQTIPSATDGNAQPALPATISDQPVIEGDPNRFKYAFFAQMPVHFPSNDFIEGTQLGFVFTQDANFCSRKAAPLHVQELLVYQYSYPEGQQNPNLDKVFNISTWPDYKSWFGPFFLEDEISKFDDPNFIWNNCSLTNTDRGGRSFSQASWALTTAPEENIDKAASVTIDFHARNKAQEVAWTLIAKRCASVNDLFQDYGGNHMRPITIPCGKRIHLKED